MGAKQSKGGKVKQNGSETAGDGDGLDTFDKTSTLPATFRSKDDELTKSGTLPREGVALDRNTSFSKRFRKSVSKLVGHKGKEEGCTDSPKTEDNLETKNEKNADLNKSNDEKDSSAKSPIDPKLAQKIARARFFQDLYSTPTNVPKPPRSRNGFSPHDNGVTADDDVDKANATPVVKLIERHQEAIEKHQEEIRNSMGSPDILKGRMDSFRKSKLVENGESHTEEKESTLIEETKQESVSSFKVEEKIENLSQSVSEEKYSVSETSSSQVTSEMSKVSESSASVVIKEESESSVLKESHAVKEEISLKSESHLVQESSTLTELVSEEIKEEKFESRQITEEVCAVQQTSQLDEKIQSEVQIETKSTSEIISQSSENKEPVGEVLNEESEEQNSGEDNDITDEKSSDGDSDAELDGNEKEK